MFSVRNFVVYSTMLMLFSDRMYVTVASINIFVFYFLVLFNLSLLWYAGSLWLPRGLLIFLGLLFLSGVVGLVRSTGSVTGFAKDFLGIAPNVVYCCAFLRFMRFNAERCFGIYSRFAFYVAVLGLVIVPFQIRVGDRLTSILAEPSSFCIACVPALFYYVDEWQRTRTHGWRAAVLLAACILTVSSVGFMGILFGLYLFGTRYRFGKILAPAVVILSGIGIYTASDLFRVRLDDTVQSLAARDMTGVNLSSFGVVSNIFVTERAFVEHPLIGGGLGSYVVAHERFINQFVGVEIFDLEGWTYFGRWDASSLFLRITAEFGLVGLACFGWFLWNFWPRSPTGPQRAIAMATLCYVFMKFVRSGTYFNAEEMFIFVVYAVNGLKARERLRSVVSSISSREPVLGLPSTPATGPAKSCGRLDSGWCLRYSRESTQGG